jgi:molybdopterin synthase sulfur carrier subunit
MATVFIPAPLRRLTSGHARLDVAAVTLADLVDRLEVQHPGLRNYLLDEGGALRAYVNVFVNATEVRALDGLQTRLRDTDEVSILPAMAGGSQVPAASGVLTAGRTRLPELRIAPSSRLLLHEECDPERVARLVARLAADGVLRNPPVAAAAEGGAYVVLDGANRVTALQRAGVPDQAIHVVDYDDAAVTLDVWAHLLADDGLAGELAAGPGWERTTVEGVRRGLDDGTHACAIVTRSETRGLRTGPTLAERIRALAGVVAAYKGRVPIYRVLPAALDALARDYGRAAALVQFPRFTKADIRAIAGLDVKLPTGISRHLVPLRALRVNVPLDLLRAAEPVADKQTRLDEMIRQRLLEHRVRHYPEPTVLFDE